MKAYLESSTTNILDLMLVC